MQRRTYRRPRPLIAVCLLVSILLGCNRNEGAPSAEKAADVRAPSPFPTRSRQLVEHVEARAATPRATVSLEGNGEGDHGVSVSANAEPDSGGVPLAVEFAGEVEGGTEGLQYRWDFGDHSVPAHQLKVQHIYQQPGEYTAVFSVSGSGVYASDEVSIEVTEEGFDVSIDADPDIGAVPLAVQFAAVLDDDLPGPFHFQWDFGDGGRDVTNPTNHTYRDTGQFTATVTVTNAAGQMARQDVEVQVDPREDDAGQN